MATVDEVDAVALAAFGSTDVDAVAFRDAWVAWGTWANGGFEYVMTGGLADEAQEVLAALRHVGALAEASLFEQAFGLVHGDLDERNAQWTPEVEAIARHLDHGMAALPPLKETHLAPMLDAHPELRSLGGEEC